MQNIIQTMSSVNSPPRGPYRIQAVARLTGIPAPTLRAWERRYGIPSPARTSSAYRQYSEDDVAIIRAMKKMGEEGMAPAEAAKLVRASPPERPAHPESPVDVFEACVVRVMAAIEAYDVDLVDMEISRASMVGNAQEIYERIVAPLLRRVGDRWHDGSLSIAQEHLASERLGNLLRNNLRLVQPNHAAKSVLLGCFADEEHVFGMLGAAMCFAAWGFRVELLGARTPPSAVGDAVRALRPSLVGLSVTVAPSASRARELSSAYAYAAGDTPWVVGGSAAASVASAVHASGGYVAEGDVAGWQKLARAWVTRAPKKRAAPRKSKGARS
jgi:DNA-binding transcriptional MerR regulator/methylmalonyl-CoA mutase cobalamin-binding subunit